MKIKVTIELVLNSVDFCNEKKFTPREALKYVECCMDGGADWPEIAKVEARELKAGE